MHPCPGVIRSNVRTCYEVQTISDTQLPLQENWRTRYSVNDVGQLGWLISRFHDEREKLLKQQDANFKGIRLVTVTHLVETVTLSTHIEITH